MIQVSYLEKKDLVLLGFKIYDKEVFNSVLLYIKTTGFFDFINIGSQKFWSTSSKCYIENCVEKELENFDDVKYVVGHYNLIKKYGTPKKKLVIKRKKYIPELTKMTPKGQYQIDGIKFLINRNFTLNADDTGLGKTVQEIAKFNHLYNDDLIDKILIITLRITKYNWKHEILRFSPIIKEEDILIVNKVNSKKKKDVFNDDIKNKKIVIMSYTNFLSIMRFYGKQNSKNKNASHKYYRKNQIPFEKWFQDKRAFLILDEGHSIKNPKAYTTKAMCLIKDYFNYISILTATPWPNNISEIFSLFYMLDDTLFGKKYKFFINSIAKVGKWIGRKFLKYSIDYFYPEKEEEIRKKILPYTLRRFKKDVLPDLPKQTIKKIYVEPTIEHIKIFQYLVTATLSKLKFNDNGEVVVTKVKNKFPFLTVVCSDPSILLNNPLFKDEQIVLDWKLEYNSKLDSCNILLEEHKKEKCIIWSTHPKTIDNLTEYYENKGLKVWKVHGSMDRNRLDDIDKILNQERIDFLTTNRYDIAILSQQVMGTGTNLTGANIFIWWDRNYDLKLYLQVFGRNYRAVSIEDVTNYMLILPGTLEESQDKMLEDKKLFDRYYLSGGIFSKQNLTKDSWQKIMTGRIDQISE